VFKLEVTVKKYEYKYKDQDGHFYAFGINNQIYASEIEKKSFFKPKFLR